MATTFAGQAGPAASSDGAGTGALFNDPGAVAVDSSGNLYVADSGNNAIREITSAGVVTTLAGSGYSGNTDGWGVWAQFDKPCGVAVDALGNVYVADSGNSTIREIAAAQG